MAVWFDQEHQTFWLAGQESSYAIRLINGKYLMHAYWGEKLAGMRTDVYRRYFSLPEAEFSQQEMRLEHMPEEFPTFGHGDLRSPALHVRQEDGSRVLDLIYAGYRIYDGKLPLSGLPASFGGNQDCQTLEITLTDEKIGLEAILSYTIFPALDMIARNVRLLNAGQAPVSIRRIFSVGFDFDRGDFQLLTLSGAWSRERQMYVRPLNPGFQGVESTRGASSLITSPFLALMDPGAAEDQGGVYGFALVYSGNFSAGVQVDQFGMARVQLGLNDFDFSWALAPGETFQAPEALTVFSAQGLGGMSRRFHAFLLKYLIRSRFKDAQRPILINNWEATYFDFNQEKLLGIAREAARLGVEMFVLDDGWFGRRDSDRLSLGDWVEDRRKLPEGLNGLSLEIHKLGMKFGVWVEPEMVSPDSDLYRAHLDWCLHVPGRECTTSRWQLILDLSRPEVCDAVYDMLHKVFSGAQIDYVKWDMNRNMTEVMSAVQEAGRQEETAHRYMLGLYGLLERITAAFPHILFESCASGGGRFDAGMLYYMPQTWCSDNSDAIARCRIQYATSLVFPPSTMGAHVSAVPNHQTGRVTPLDTRAAVAMGGSFGYELDVARLPEEEKEQIARWNEYVKQVRGTMLYGTHYRLRNPFEGNEAAWMSVSPDKSEALVTYVQVLAVSNTKNSVLKLKGLDPGRDYLVDKTGETLSGAELMRYGLVIPTERGDYCSQVYHLTSIEK